MRRLFQSCQMWQSHTDYDYALVHLFVQSMEYYDFFEDAMKNKNREVILDNSVFELGTAMSTYEYATWVDTLKPTAYIIPDVLEDMEQTIHNIEDWKYDLPGETIGVLQGKSTAEIIECYKAIVDKVDRIAISFDMSFFETQFPHTANKYYSWMRGRLELLYGMRDQNILKSGKKHHLLGCSLPQEFVTYRSDFTDILYSLDTSNPVLHGLHNVPYEWCKFSDHYMLDEKNTSKMVNFIKDDVAFSADVAYNIRSFRYNVTGKQ